MSENPVDTKIDEPVSPAEAQKMALAKAFEEAKKRGGGGVIDAGPPAAQPFITDDAKTAIGELELIGGYVLVDPKTEERKLLNLAVMREMTGNEEDVMTNSKMEMGRRFHTIIGNCLTRIGDGKGTYITDTNRMHSIVDKLTVADRAQMLLFLRIISVPDGHRYTFKANCPQCGNDFQQTVNLAALNKYPMSDPSERLYDVELSDGRVARCRIMLGEHEKITDKASQRGQDILSASLLARVVEINGQPFTMQVAKSLLMRDRNKLREEFRQREGGVETTTQAMCGACGSKLTIDIDITQSGFFFPSETQKT